MNVLITSAGKRVELVQLIKETLDNMGLESTVIAADITRTAPALYFADKYHIVSRCDEPQFVGDIISISSSENIDVIIPTIDTELSILSRNADNIHTKTGARVMISDPGIIDIFFDKIKTDRFFRDNGIPVPRLYTRGDAIESNVIVKPISGSAARGVKMVKPEYFRWEDVEDNYIVQHASPGDEITIDAFFDFKGNIVSKSMRERIRVRDGEVQIGRMVWHQKISDYIDKLSGINRFKGGVTFQAFIDCVDVSFIECNPRFGGGLPFTIMSGNNFLRYLFEIIEYGKIDTGSVNKSETGIVFSRYDQSVRIDD